MTSRTEEAMKILRSDLEKSFGQVLPNSALAVSLAELAMWRVLFGFAGQTLHFRKIDSIQDRNARIKAEHEAGSTVEAIAEQEHLGPRHVRRILKMCA
jgi:hypothetical protein